MAVVRACRHLDFLVDTPISHLFIDFSCFTQISLLYVDPRPVSGFSTLDPQRRTVFSLLLPFLEIDVPRLRSVSSCDIYTREAVDKYVHLS